MTKKKSTISLSFYGAAGTVTGSRYLVQTPDQKILIDCGLFQGYKNLRLRNWSNFPLSPKSLNAVLLTHAHLDHSGYLPALIEQGFKGNIYCSHATMELCEILLIDAGKIQEEEANYFNKKGISKHHPPLPLFTIDQAKKALQQFKPVNFNEEVEIGHSRATFIPNGHILGSCMVKLDILGRQIVFSGDIGRPHDYIMPAPFPPPYCDYLIIESTYGDKLHEKNTVEESLAEIISKTAKGGGSLLIPAFAVGRAQTMLYLIHKLRKQNEIPFMPIYLDSPMAVSATELMIKNCKLHRLNKQECFNIGKDVIFTRTVEESIELANVSMPYILISASGMATGGRVLHHLKRMLPNHRNTVIFAGYQAAGTRGARLVNGDTATKIHGRYYPVNATIINFDFLSAHADSEELIRWLQQSPVAPKKCFITHGEPEASDCLRIKIQEKLGWNVLVPCWRETVQL